MKNKQIFIHLGFPKTGSTYLQQYIFPEMKEALFLGKPFNRTIEILESKILQLNETQYYIVQKNSLLGIIRANGEVTLKNEYSNIIQISPSYLKLIKDEEMLYFNLINKEFIKINSK